jgi:hypothetical protein
MKSVQWEQSYYIQTDRQTSEQTDRHYKAFRKLANAPETNFKGAVCESMDWHNVAYARDKWQAVVKTVMNFRLPYNEVVFNIWEIIGFWRTLLDGVIWLCIRFYKTADVVIFLWLRKLFCYTKNRMQVEYKRSASASN